LASEIVWAPVKVESWWQVAIDDITFNNMPKGLCNGACQVAVDTGTSMLAGPSDLVDKLSNMVNAKDDCSNFNELPNLGFQIGDTVLNLKPDDYMDRSAAGCSFSLMALDVPPPKGPVFIFGDPFLRRFVTIYDRSKPAVGFAVAKHNGVADEAAAQELISHVHGAGGSQRSESAPADASGSNAVSMHLDGGLMTGAEGGSDDEASSSSSSSSEASSSSPSSSSNSAPEPPAAPASYAAGRSEDSSTEASSSSSSSSSNSLSDDNFGYNSKASSSGGSSSSSSLSDDNFGYNSKVTVSSSSASAAEDAFGYSKVLAGDSSPPSPISDSSSLDSSSAKQQGASATPAASKSDDAVVAMRKLLHMNALNQERKRKGEHWWSRTEGGSSLISVKLFRDGKDSKKKQK